MINNEKIGSYVRILRRKHHMTQEVLASKLYISRQAISSWEKGKTAPSIDNITDMSKLFNVSIADLYAGEEVTDKQTLNDIIHSLITLEIKRWKKYLIIACVLLFILLIAYFVNYFLVYYNNIIVYNIKGDSYTYDINGIINKSVNNLYFNLETDKVSDRICLVHNEDELVCESNTNYIIFSEYKGYNEMIPLDNKSFKDYISNLYIRINNNNQYENIKLDIFLYYQNSNLINSEDTEVNNDVNYKLEFADVPEKIRKEFEYNKEENKYYVKYNKNKIEIQIIFFVNSQQLYVNEIDEKLTKHYTYYLNSNIIDTYDIVNNSNGKNIESYNHITSNSKNNKEKEIYDYFKNNYIDKYLK